MPLSIEPTTPLADLAERTIQRFTQTYGREPTVVAAAPGRVNIIGEHTDYNDGFVLPMAIDRYTVIAADAADHREVRVSSATMGETLTAPVRGPLPAGAPGWGPYVRGVIDAFGENGFDSVAIDGVIDSTVPLGGGLSSSAALEVALATAMGRLAGWELPVKQKALLCQAAEHKAGTPCGIMDQFASALCQADHLMLLDCRDQSIDQQRFDDPSVTVLITNSNVKHELTGGEYAERRQQCEEAARRLGVSSLRNAELVQLGNSTLTDDVLHRRARHIISEIGRTPKCAEAIAERRWTDAGHLMYASHASLRDDFEVSCPELDVLVEAAEGIGADGGLIGSRMTGGGFGGCTVSLVYADAAGGVATRMAADYEQRTGQHATQFLTRPARGAHLLWS